MGAHEPAHAGQLLASQRQAASPTTPEEECVYCGGNLADQTKERVEHTIPTPDGSDRTELYCSPSCFLRRMQRVGGIEQD